MDYMISLNLSMGPRQAKTPSHILPGSSLTSVYPPQPQLLRFEKHLKSPETVPLKNIYYPLKANAFAFVLVSLASGSC